jgi:tetratricopeptide (TPR) repeat protein
MTHPTLSLLDQTELLQLARNASSADDSASAIAYLKEAVSRTDATGAAHYLLGAEYAQIGMYERAVGEMESAIALDPALATARLQLGLLWLGGGAVERAEAVLSPLAELAADDPLRHFGAGLSLLIKNQLNEAVARLEQGITLNAGNAPLNQDMRKIIDEIGRVRSGAAPGPAPAAQPAPAAADAENSQHILLSAYTGKTTH